MGLDGPELVGSYQNALAQAFHVCMVFETVLAGVQLVALCSVWRLRPGSEDKVDKH